MQPVRQLDDHHPYVVGGAIATNILRRFSAWTSRSNRARHPWKLKRRQLRRPIDKFGDVDTKLVDELRFASPRSPPSRRAATPPAMPATSSLQLGAGHRGRKRMLYVRMPGTTQMTLVLLLGVLVRRRAPGRESTGARYCSNTSTNTSIVGCFVRSTTSAGTVCVAITRSYKAKSFTCRRRMTEAVNSRRVCTMTCEDRT